jgi:hypothetical protein
LTKQGGGSWWRLAGGTIALLLLAPGSLGLVSLSLAALLVAAGLRRPREYVVAALAGALGVLSIAWPPTNPLASAFDAYTVVVASAFTGGALVAPTRVLRQALRATVTGLAAIALLGLVMRGITFWSELHWSVVRQISSALRFMVQVRPESFELFTAVARTLGRAYPVLVILQTLAALGLAWHWHVRFAVAPLEASVRASGNPRPEAQSGEQRGGAPETIVDLPGGHARSRAVVVGPAHPSMVRPAVL